MDAHDCARLLSLLSHELRGPLGVTRGYLRLLEREGDAGTDAHVRAVRGALQASDRMADLLAQASLLARLGRGEHTFTVAAAALADLLHGAAETARRTDETLTITIAEVPAVSLDADREALERALTALIRAVARALGDDAHLSIAAERQSRAEGEGVQLVIGPAAAGPGPEVPLDLTRGGLGLELPLAALALEAHGGTASERRGEGPAFAVVAWLPTAS